MKLYLRVGSMRHCLKRLSDSQTRVFESQAPDQRGQPLAILTSMPWVRERSSSQNPGQRGKRVAAGGNAITASCVRREPAGASADIADGAALRESGAILGRCATVG